MGFTPIEIDNQKFDTRLRGYDRTQVKGFLSALAESAAHMSSERTLLQDEVSDLRRQLDEYREREKAIGETLCALRELSARMKEDAKKEGELILREAHLKADHLLEQARLEAIRLESQISEIRVERDTFEDRLRLLIDEHQRLLILRQNPDWKESFRSGRKKPAAVQQ